MIDNKRQQELDFAVIKLYNDYKDTINKYNKGDLDFITKLVEINNDNKKYTKEEVYYIGFNALFLLQEDIKIKGYNNIKEIK